MTFYASPENLQNLTKLISPQCDIYIYIYIYIYWSFVPSPTLSRVDSISVTIDITSLAQSQQQDDELRNCSSRTHHPGCRKYQSRERQQNCFATHLPTDHDHSSLFHSEDKSSCTSTTLATLERRPLPNWFRNASCGRVSAKTVASGLVRVNRASGPKFAPTLRLLQQNFLCHLDASYMSILT